MRIRLQGTARTKTVRLNGKQLDPAPSQAIWNHSPDGFNWGYGGSGPAQLALAVMLEVAPEQTARRNYQQFKDEIALLENDQDFDVFIDMDEYLDPGMPY
jgi:hypothetical protein